MADEAPDDRMSAHARNLWFDDGNVVFVSGERKYRVYRGILAQQSSFFRDMFRIPQPPDEPTYEGCPIIHIQDDPLEFMYLLSAVFVRSYIENLADGDISEVCACIVAMAQKYSFEIVQADAMRRLRTIYPSTFGELKTNKNFIWDTHPSHFPHAITVINIARRIRVPDKIHELLPAAFYMCCQLDETVLVCGVTRMDGNLSRLSTEDLARCIRGIKRLVAANEYMLHWLAASSREISEECKTREDCAKALEYLDDVAHTDGLYSSSNPMTSLAKYIRRAGEDWDMCVTCIEFLTEENVCELMGCWDNLRMFFQIQEGAD